MISTTDTKTMMRDNFTWLSQWQNTSLLPRAWYDEAPPKSRVIFALEWHHFIHLPSLHFMIWVSVVLSQRLQHNITLRSGSWTIEIKCTVNISPISTKARKVYHITLHLLSCFCSYNNIFVSTSIICVMQRLTI
jgi:hypothetical protein